MGRVTQTSRARSGPFSAVINLPVLGGGVTAPVDGQVVAGDNAPAAPGASIDIGDKGVTGGLTVRDKDDRPAITLNGGSGTLTLGTGKGAAGQLVLRSDKNGPVMLVTGKDCRISFLDAQLRKTLSIDGLRGDIEFVGADCAEDFDVAEDAAPGDVVCIAEDGRLHPCKEDYDSKVIGVVSGAGGFRPALRLDRGNPGPRPPTSRSRRQGLLLGRRRPSVRCDGRPPHHLRVSRACHEGDGRGPFVRISDRQEPGVPAWRARTGAGARRPPVGVVMALRVAIVGDSAMWGQGLLHEHTYSHLASTEIARMLDRPLEIVPGRSPLAPERGEARSGAKLRPRQGGPGDESDATKFIGNFPRLFNSEQERLDLQFGTDEGAGARLFGEHPATFPTVVDGLRALRAHTSATVDLVLLDGGINDLDFEEVLNPEGAGIRKIEQQIQSIFEESLRQSLLEARRSFPNAVVVVVGYFSALSLRSSRSELEALFKYLAGKPDWQVFLNDFVQNVPVVKDILNSFLTKDVDKLIEQAIGRSLVAAAYAHFFTARTVSTLPGDIRGPGVVYAHPGFTPANALFAGGASLLYNNYRQPGEGGREVDDEMLATRTRNIPRVELLDDYARIAVQLLPFLFADLTDDARREIKVLLRERDLPTPLREHGERLANGSDNAGLTDFMRDLSREVGRIEVARIASFLHPSPRGARRIADRIVRAYREHVAFSVRSAVLGRGGGARTESLTRWMRDRGLDPAGGIRSIRRFAHVESVGLQFEGLESGLFPMELIVGAEKYFMAASRSSSKRFFQAFDTQVELTDLDRLILRPVALGTIGNEVPGFDRVRIFVNGQDFHVFAGSGKSLDEGDSLEIWPSSS